VLRIRDVYPGSEFILSLIGIISSPDPGSASKTLSILTLKNVFQALGNMILVVLTGSWGQKGTKPRILGSKRHPIPDPGVKKAPDPGSATLLRHINTYKFKLLLHSTENFKIYLFTNLYRMMFRLLLHSLMRGDIREPRTIIEANSWYLIRDPESIKVSHTLLQVVFT
jgi:hypothetical protein